VIVKADIKQVNSHWRLPSWPSTIYKDSKSQVWDSIMLLTGNLHFII